MNPSRMTRPSMLNWLAGGGIFPDFPVTPQQEKRHNQKTAKARAQRQKMKKFDRTNCCGKRHRQNMGARWAYTEVQARVNHE